MTAYLRQCSYKRAAADLPVHSVAGLSLNLREASVYRLRPKTASSYPLPRLQGIRSQEVDCTAVTAYRCPTCSQPLRGSDKGTLICDAGHTILRAKEGYVHLRPSGRKVALNAAGDSPEMVKARRRFFDARHYDIVADQIGSIIADALAGYNEVSILDAGCGEGMYLARVQATLHETGKECEAFGVDVSKTAIRMAAKRHKEASFAVASSYALPFDDQVFDGVISVFAPVAAQEFVRVLRGPGGILVVAYPGERHLIELKRLLYEQPRLFSENSIPGADLLQAGFEQAQTIRVRRELTLTQSEAADLLGMTPFFWHAPEDITSRMVIETGFRTTVDILLAAFTRTEHSG